MRGLKASRKEGADAAIPLSSNRTTTLGPTKTIKRLRNVRASMPRFHYLPNRLLDLDQISASHIQVRVCASHISPRNDAIKKRLLWGPTLESRNSIFEYTNDSDVVAMLVHSGFIALPRSRSISPTFAALLVTLRVVRRGLPKFVSYKSNNLRSRAWEAPYHAPTISISRVVALDAQASQVALPPHVVVRVVNDIPRIAPHDDSITSNAPISSTGNMLSPEIVTFDLSNRPALVFSLAAVADKGSDRTLWPSKRLSREVMYIETTRKRFEVTRTDPPERKPDGNEKRREDGKEKKKGLYVRFAEVNRRVVQRELFEDQATAAPLKESDLALIAVVKWSALKWDPSGLSLGEHHYDLKRVFYRPFNYRPKKDQAEEQEDNLGSNQTQHSTQRVNTS